MDHEDFISTVERLGGVHGEGVEGATRAVLQTLGERISAAEARDLAAELPLELTAWVFSEHAGQGFDVDEFLRRVAEREGVDTANAERHVRAVFTALSQTLSDEEFADVVAQLPKDFAFLLPRGPDVEPIPFDVLREEVAERAGLDVESAGRATEVVLETLAERIAPGEVDDLIARLLVPLHEPLKRGRAGNPGAAQRMPLEDFLGRLAEREGVTPDEARTHARAVLTTLRAAVATRSSSTSPSSCHPSTRRCGSARLPVPDCEIAFVTPPGTRWGLSTLPTREGAGVSRCCPRGGWRAASRALGSARRVSEPRAGAAS